jgi:hypothetical protein
MLRFERLKIALKNLLFQQFIRKISMEDARSLIDIFQRLVFKHATQLPSVPLTSQEPSIKNTESTVKACT